MSTNIIELLNDFGAEMHQRFPLINDGGCCVFASLVARRLSAFFPTRIVVGDDEVSTTIDLAREYAADNCIYQWNDAGIGFGHVIVEFDCGGKTYHYDTSGCVEKSDTTNLFDYKIYAGYLTVQEAEELASTPRGWNTVFNRKDIPEIKWLVKRFFDRYVREIMHDERIAA